MPRYTEKQKAALDALMRDDVHRHAVEIIESEGLPALTLDQLAKAVGVSRATLYNYFADRDAIVDFVEDRTFSPVLDVLEEIGGRDLPPPAKMEAFVSKIFEALYENRVLVVALSPTHHKGPQQGGQAARFNRALAVCRNIVQQGIDAGDFRALPTDLAGEIILSSMSGLVDTMAQSGELRKPQEIVPTFMTIVLGGLNR